MIKKINGVIRSNQIYTVGQLKKLLTPVFRQYNINKAILFGSYGKGRAASDSDVDLLVDSVLRGLSFVGLTEDMLNAIDKKAEVPDVTHLIKDSEIDKELKMTGVVI